MSPGKRGKQHYKVPSSSGVLPSGREKGALMVSRGHRLESLLVTFSCHCTYLVLFLSPLRSPREVSQAFPSWGLDGCSSTCVSFLNVNGMHLFYPLTRGHIRWSRSQKYLIGFQLRTQTKFSMYVRSVKDWCVFTFVFKIVCECMLMFVWNLSDRHVLTYCHVPL